MAAVSALIKRIWDILYIYHWECRKHFIQTSLCFCTTGAAFVRFAFEWSPLSALPWTNQKFTPWVLHGWSLIPCEARKTVETQDVIQVHLFDHGLVIWNGDVRIYDKGQHIFSKSLATSWTWQKIKSIPACCTVWGMNIQGMLWSDQAVDFSIFLGVESEISQGWVRDDHFLPECIQLPHIHLISCILF